MPIPPATRRHHGLSVSRTLAVLSLLAALLAGAGTIYQRFWLHWPTGEGPAGPSVDRGAFARPWTERPVLLLGIGDSVTAGLGSSPGKSYFDRLTANPPDEFPDMAGISLSAVLPQLSATNLAESGSTSLQHLSRQIPRLPVAQADTLGIVVITTGGNDIIHNYGRMAPREGAMFGAGLDQAQPWIRAFEERLEAMIQRVQAAFPGGCHIFLANIYDPTDGIGDIERAGMPRWPDGLAIHREYNEIIRRCALRHEAVHLVDLHGAFLGHGIHCRQFWRPFHDAADPHYWYYVNIEDPNDRGYDAIRRLFLGEMARVLAPSQSF